MGRKSDSAAATRVAIRAALAVRPMRLMEITDRLYPDIPRTSRKRTASNVFYHLTHLCTTGEIHARETDSCSCVYHLGHGVQPLAEVDSQDYAVERTPTDHGTTLVSFGRRWKAGTGQGTGHRPGQGYCSLYVESPL